MWLMCYGQIKKFRFYGIHSTPPLPLPLIRGEDRGEGLCCHISRAKAINDIIFYEKGKEPTLGIPLNFIFFIRLIIFFISLN